MSELRQYSNQFFGEPIDERRVLRLPADVREREHGDRRLDGRERGRVSSAVSQPYGERDDGYGDERQQQIPRRAPVCRFDLLGVTPSIGIDLLLRRKIGRR